MVSFGKDLRCDNKNLKEISLKFSILNEHEKQFAFAFKDLLENAIRKFGKMEMDSISEGIAFKPFEHVFKIFKCTIFFVFR